MKYRCLTHRELRELGSDFEAFLIEQGMRYDQWDQFSEERPEGALKLVERFSDLIFGKVLQDVKYLEYRTPKSLRLFECREDKLILIGLDVDQTSNLDLTEEASANYFFTENSQGIKSFKTERPYAQEREDEVYQLMQSGCYAVDGNSFKHLDLLRKALQN